MGAPLNPVPQVLKIILKGFVDNLAQNVWANVLHARYTGGPPSNADCAQLALQCRNAWETHVASLCPSQTTLQEVQVTDLSSTASGQGATTLISTGTRGDDAIPANAAALISYLAPVRFKGGHPRTYLYVGGNADLQGAAEWATAFVTEVQTKWNAFLSAINGLPAGTTTTSSPGWVRYHGKFLPNDGPPHYYLTNPLFEAYPSTGGTCQTEMASQRGRIGRREQ